MFAEDGQASASAADGDALIDAALERSRQGSVFPESNVVPLVPTGEEDGFGFVDAIENSRVRGGFAGAEDHGGDRIDSAEFLDEGVVGGSAAGAEDEEVATSGTFDEPAEGFFDILAATHEEIAGLRIISGDVFGVAGTGLVDGRSLGGGGEGEEEQETN